MYLLLFDINAGHQITLIMHPQKGSETDTPW